MSYRSARPLAYIFLQFQIMNWLPKKLLCTYDVKLETSHLIGLSQPK